MVKPELQRCARIALTAVGGGRRYAPVASAPVAALYQQKEGVALVVLGYMVLIRHKGCYNIIYAELIIIMMYILRGVRLLMLYYLCKDVKKLRERSNMCCINMNKYTRAT